MEGFDYGALRFWFTVFQWAATILVALYAWWVGRSRATSEAMAEISKRIDENSRRLELLEKDVRDAPGHTEIHALRDDVASLRADVRELNGTMRGMNRAVDLMTEHLMNKGGK